MNYRYFVALALFLGLNAHSQTFSCYNFETSKTPNYASPPSQNPDFTICPDKKIPHIINATNHENSVDEQKTYCEHSYYIIEGIDRAEVLPALICTLNDQSQLIFLTTKNFAFTQSLQTSSSTEFYCLFQPDLRHFSNKNIL